MGTSKDALEKVSLLALEDWGLMFTEPAEFKSELFDDDEKTFCAHMQFKGEDILMGTVIVVSQYPFIEALCNNLLGSMDGAVLDEERAKDCVKEMANVLAGNLVTEVWGEDTVFELFSPSVEVYPSGEAVDILGPTMSCFLADDEPVVISVIEQKMSNAS